MAGLNNLNLFEFSQMFYFKYKPSRFLKTKLLTPAGFEHESSEMETITALTTKPLLQSD